jgi:hypothetical protein
MSRPSSFKFDTHLGTKQRIAHKTTTSSSLLNDLEHKKQSITQVSSFFLYSLNNHFYVGPFQQTIAKKITKI